MKLNNKGFSMIEAIAVLGLLALISAGLVQLNLTFSRSVASTSLNIKAEAVAVETMEAFSALRDESWSNLSALSPDTFYYLSYSDSLKKWSINSSDSGPVEGVFTRSFKIYPVYRDAADGHIVLSGGSYDNNIVRVEAEIDWNDHGVVKNKKLVSYISNF